ncbi:hypothetical protein [Trichormus variabilis]|uniref:hypothetical protein n=1 Tax=Anabaena variabilis TaxID=264691 RepID=UPI001682000E|nr:hypothetical protein [Trichormus variabilis]MBD2629867.1 hypothetical protein [Trichormus variabilis FACHB-164]
MKKSVAAVPQQTNLFSLLFPPLDQKNQLDVVLETNQNELAIFKIQNFYWGLD